MPRKPIVVHNLTFEEAKKLSAAYKRAPKFYSGVSWDNVNPEYEEIEENHASRLAEQPGVKCIFSGPVGGRGPEIIVQD